MSPQKKHQITFKPSGRGKAQCPPNPNFPDGISLDASRAGLPACDIDIPYPAPECGHWDIECQECGMRLAITAAGRPDDPRGVRVECAKAQWN